VEGQGKHFLDLQADFVEAGEEDLFLDSVHPTARGHGIAARAILRILEQRGLAVH
jgi:phospholipase/lecithinase/hemolysin